MKNRARSISVRVSHVEAVRVYELARVNDWPISEAVRFLFAQGFRRLESSPADLPKQFDSSSTVELGTKIPDRGLPSPVSLGGGF